MQGHTGFPWIDAIMKQLVSEGWIHGLAKHALITFITHGMLFFSWQEAAKVLVYLFFLLSKLTSRSSNSGHDLRF